MAADVGLKNQIKCPSCGSDNDPRDEWCESCLADLALPRSSSMFVRKWTPRHRADRP